MKNQQKTSILFVAFCFLFYVPLYSQLSSNTIGPSNGVAMVDEIAFLYQPQLGIPTSSLSNFIHSHPVPISISGSCTNSKPKIVSQDDNNISFRWQPEPGAQITYWIRYLNIQTGEQGITSTTGTTINFALENGVYIFLFQKSCNGEGSNEYIIIDDKPISFGPTEEECNCETLTPVAFTDNFDGQVLSAWPSDNSFVETYYVRVYTYFGESDFETPPDMYSSFAFNAYGGNGSVYLLEYKNACSMNADHDYCAIFSTDDSNQDLEEEGGNESPAFLQFTFSEGIEMNPLGDFYQGKIFIRKCANSSAFLTSQVPRFRLPFRASPNPTNDQVELSYQLSQRERVQLQLHNAYGQVVKVIAVGMQDAGPQQLSLDLSPLPAGAYYCRLQGETMAEGLWMIKN